MYVQSLPCPGIGPVYCENAWRRGGWHGLARYQCEHYPNREWPWLCLRLLRRDMVAAQTERRIKAVGYFTIVGVGEARWLAGRGCCVTCRQERLGAPLSRLRVTNCRHRASPYAAGFLPGMLLGCLGKATLALAMPFLGRKRKRRLPDIRRRGLALWFR
jgi:hypothetical protein